MGVEGIRDICLLLKVVVAVVVVAVVGFVSCH